ncbi:restriction endonuclease subunit S [Paenibacillus lautus]|uniref:restriction endonuclease subunit S n=1 Tax=Paenibacillus lautus TaxID=1401 RepID=UPI002DBC4353|nr:restriction endonuclease subunit S [Paenibacillus lautus]MEC0259343.1 restriction endonuclease subunit S [Paenibacillus lautus]
MGNKRIPEVRFQGFTGEWEERKLGDIADFSKGNGYSKSDLTDEGSPIILYGRLYTKYETVIKSVDTFTIEQGKSVISRGNEVIVPSSGETSEDISRASVVSNPGIILGGDLNIVRPGNEIDPVFLALTISNGKQQKELSKRAQGKSVVHLHNSDLKEVSLIFPKKEEQKKIGNIFEQLDDTIALHQQELNTLKQTKQGFLQKMFPKEGESLPEIRFPGFSGGWKKRKLGEISEKVSEKNKDNIYSETLTNSAEFGIINQRDFFDKDISNEKNLDGYYVVRPDDFVYNPRISNLAPVGPIKRNNLGRTGVMSPLYYVFRTHDVDKTYLEKYFSSNSWHIFMKLNGDSGARSDRFAIKDSVFREMPIPMPSIDEQSQISKFFKQLDDTIALHQRELDALKETKKAFLQKMFI